MEHNRELNIGLLCDNPEKRLEVLPAMEFDIVFELLIWSLLLRVLLLLLQVSKG